MKVKTAKVLGILISALVLFASCGQLAENGGESQVTISLPYVADANSRAIESGRKDDLINATASYRVHMNDRVLEGAGGNFSAYFPVGTKVDVFIECVNAKGEVILRTVTKSLVVASGENVIDFNLMADGNEITPSAPPPPPAPPTIEYVNITFNQGFVYTNTVHQPSNTWIAMTGASLPNSGQREKGSSVSADQATAAGYVFKGWVENSQSPSGDAPDAQSFNYVQKYDSDMTLYAIWEQIEPGSHSVKFAGGTTTGSSASGLPQGFQQQENTQATFSGTPTCPGYEFAGWNANVPGVNVIQQGNSWTFTMPTSEVTLTAQWNIITYTLSYEANDGQATPAQTETFTVAAGGANVTLKAANTFTRTGYTLSQWNAGNNNRSPSTDVAKTSLIALATGSGTNRTITLTAQWTINRYSVTVSAGNGVQPGDVQNLPSIGQKEYNATVQLGTEPTRTGYTFTGWQVAPNTLQISGSGNDRSFTMPAQAVTLTAQWTPITYTVNFNGDGATGSENPITFTVADTGRNFPSTTGFTKTENRFSHWATTQGGTSILLDYIISQLKMGNTVSGLTIGSNNDITIYAVWESIYRELSEAVVGDVICANGKVLSASDITTELQSQTVAVVYKVDTNARKVWAVGKSLSSSGMAWAINSAEGYNTKITDLKEEQGYTDYTDGSTGFGKLRTAVNDADDADLATNYPAWDYACNYGTNSATNANIPTGMQSGWYLPCKQELEEVYNNKSTIETALAQTGVSKTSFDTGDTDRYWSSSQTYLDDSAYGINFKSTIATNAKKDTLYCVCAVRQFTW